MYELAQLQDEKKAARKEEQAIDTARRQAKDAKDAKPKLATKANPEKHAAPKKPAPPPPTTNPELIPELIKARIQALNLRQTAEKFKMAQEKFPDDKLEALKSKYPGYESMAGYEGTPGFEGIRGMRVWLGTRVCRGSRVSGV